MEKFVNKGKVISFEVKNDYSIVAIYKSINDDKLSVSLYLKHKKIEDFRFIRTGELTSKWKTAKINICSLIDGMLKTGEIDLQINNYEYELNCFDKGDKFFQSRKQINLSQI